MKFVLEFDVKIKYFKKIDWERSRKTVKVKKTLTFKKSTD